MSNIWITSDWHFNHNKEFIFQPRGYSNVNEMNEDIILKHNKIVSPEDDVYCLGDCCLGGSDVIMSEKNKHLIERLNGKIHLVRGNHCTEKRIKMYAECWNVVELCGWATVIKSGKQSIYLSHYPTITSNYDIDKPLKARVISVCGHSHTKDPFADWDKGLIFHCELDTNNCKPWNLEDILKAIRKRLDK